jgi:hypothetical protein
MGGQEPAAPADGNSFNVEVVVMLDPPETRTRPTVSTESSFSTLKMGTTSASLVEDSSPTLSGNATTLPEHTTTSASTTEASYAVYNKTTSTINITDPSQRVNDSGNVTNATESIPIAHIESTNITVPASNPMYIRTNPAIIPPVAGESTNSVEKWNDVPMSSSRGNVRGKQQEKNYDDAIPYQKYNYETTKRNEEKRMGSNKAMRRQHRG